MFALPVLLPALLGCGPSRQDLAVLAHTLEVDPFPKADQVYTDTLTMLGEPPVGGDSCGTIFEEDAAQVAADLAEWERMNPRAEGRRAAVRSRWLPLQAGRTTVARTSGRAAAQGSASHTLRVAHMTAYTSTPGFTDVAFEDQLAGAQNLAELPLEPELVVIVRDATRLDAWLFDPTEKRMVCGGTTGVLDAASAAILAHWVEAEPKVGPDAESLAALTRIAQASLRAIPAPVTPAIASPAAPVAAVPAATTPPVQAPESTGTDAVADETSAAAASPEPDRR